jgi:hypothetical protein
MGHLKLASIVFAVAAVSLAVGTGALSSVSADRGVEISVADDDEALLGVTTVGSDAIQSDGSTRSRDIVRITNRFADSITVDTTVTDPGGRPVLETARLDDGSLAAGEQATLTAEIRCASGNSTSVETWTVHVTATGDGVSVETTTEVTVECSGIGGEDITPE